VNFSGIKDPIIDQDLDQGRSETDPAKRTALYRNMNEEFAKQVYELWTWYTRWAVGAQTTSAASRHALPNGGGQPFALYEGVIPTVSLYKK